MLPILPGFFPTTSSVPFGLSTILGGIANESLPGYTLTVPQGTAKGYKDKRSIHRAEKMPKVADYSESVLKLSTNFHSGFME